MNMKRYIPVLIVSLICIVILALLLPFSGADRENNASVSDTDAISDTISRIVAACPGEIGVAVIINSTDTVTVNDKSIYPMMSVFKMHQAIAVCRRFDHEGISLDTVVTIRSDELNPDTWSPMMKEHQEPIIRLSVRDLLRYTLTLSDNNASNFMFERMVDVPTTDSVIASLIPRSSFQIAYSEADMAAEHDKAYSNYTSPLGAAMLMDRLFTDSLLSRDKQDFITTTLGECNTGKDRIAAPLLGRKGVSVAHKTGSGYINEKGVLAAHNDVAYVRLPNGVCYTLAVFVKDFNGNESQAAKVIAHISAAVYSILAQSR